MRYQVDRFRPDGTRIDSIQNFNTLSYVRTENEIGALVLTIPLKAFKYEDWSVNQVLEIWREKNGVLELQNETAYFVQDWELYNDAGQHMIAVFAKDANWLLDTRIVAHYAGSTDSTKTDYADDMMKEIVYSNMGAGTTDTDRVLSGFTIAPDTSASVSITRSFAWGQLTGVMQDICNSATEQGTYTCFDVVRTSPCNFEFRTYTGQRGVDHGRTSGDVRLVGEIYGNLEDARLGTYHGEEWNYVYAGGEGEEYARIIETASDAARIGQGYPYNRREYFQDARQQATTDAVYSDAYAALGEGKPKQVMSGKLVDTYGMQFGIHYGFGDIVSVEAFDTAVDCHVTSVGVKYDAENGEQIDIRLRGEL